MKVAHLISFLLATASARPLLAPALSLEASDAAAAGSSAPEPEHMLGVGTLQVEFDQFACLLGNLPSENTFFKLPILIPSLLGELSSA